MDVNKSTWPPGKVAARPSPDAEPRTVGFDQRIHAPAERTGASVVVAGAHKATHHQAATSPRRVVLYRQVGLPEEVVRLLVRRACIAIDCSETIIRHQQERTMAEQTLEAEQQRPCVPRALMSVHPHAAGAAAKMLLQTTETDRSRDTHHLQGKSMAFQPAARDPSRDTLADRQDTGSREPGGHAKLTDRERIGEAGREEGTLAPLTATEGATRNPEEDGRHTSKRLRAPKFLRKNLRLADCDWRTDDHLSVPSDSESAHEPPSDSSKESESASESDGDENGFSMLSGRSLDPADIAFRSRSTHHNKRQKVRHVENESSPECIPSQHSMVFDPMDVACSIKASFDRDFGGAWQCVIGREFGCAITHELQRMCFLRIDDSYIALYQSHPPRQDGIAQPRSVRAPAPQPGKMPHNPQRQHPLPGPGLHVHGTTHAASEGADVEHSRGREPSGNHDFPRALQLSNQVSHPLTRERPGLSGQALSADYHAEPETAASLLEPYDAQGGDFDEALQHVGDLPFDGIFDGDYNTEQLDEATKAIFAGASSSSSAGV